MASAEQKVSLVAAILALFGGAAYLLLRKKSVSASALPAGTATVTVAGQQVPYSATVPTPDNVKARAFGPAIASVYSDGPRYTCPVGSHVEYAGDGSAWCVLNTPAPQSRHTLSIGSATVTIPTQLNPLVDLWNLFSGKQPPAMPPIEKRSV